MNSRNSFAVAWATAGIACLLSLAGLTAQAQTTSTLGRVTEAAKPSAGLGANAKRASRFTISTPATIIRLCAYLDGKGGATGDQPFSLVLYSDNNGTPGKKIFETGNSPVGAGDRAWWRCSTEVKDDDTLSLHQVPAGSYWIAIHTGSPGGIIRDYGDGAANWYGNADNFSDGASATFGSGTKGSVTMSVYAIYYPDSQLRRAGRTTAGSNPSAGMTADFKRGSSFQLPERGKVFAVDAYVDGGGKPAQSNGFPGEPPYQTMEYVIYKDVNGFPGQEVYSGGYPRIPSGSPGQWVVDPALQIAPWRPDVLSVAPTLDAGRYWIALLTSSEVSGGIIRNFGDGTRGNWYGNADSYEDGPTLQFGPGTSGNGTISASVWYRPGTITSGQIGRTDVATKPSAALPANSLRWSQFTAPHEGPDATLTGLSAYLDGLGASVGSQKVKMVLYKEDVNAGAVPNEVVESEEVTIAAGMKPQWVHFNVPSVAIKLGSGPYLIAILSGGDASVIRAYADGRYFQEAYWNPQWCSTTDPYPSALGNLAAYTPCSTGSPQQQLSVYATYSLPPP